jgi:hypothetical protein
MTLYYQDDWVTIYHGDCRTVDVWLGGDVMITDPPYGVSYVSNRAKAGPSTPIAGDDDTQLRDGALALWGDRPAAVFGKWTVPHPTGTRHQIIWDKGDDPGTGDLALPWGNSFEEIYVLGDGWTGSRRSNVLRVPTLRGDARPDHPTPKPPALLRLLVGCAPAGVVVDPFAGTGSTLRAAKDLQRQAIGVEMDARYCQMAALLCAQEVLPWGPT